MVPHSKLLSLDTWSYNIAGSMPRKQRVEQCPKHITHDLGRDRTQAGKGQRASFTNARWYTVGYLYVLPEAMPKPQWAGTLSFWTPL
jgi:hypothetical protein